MDSLSLLSTAQKNVQGDLIGCRTGNGEKVSSSQAEAINSAVV